jgi:hypothetical protein
MDQGLRGAKARRGREEKMHIIPILVSTISYMYLSSGILFYDLHVILDPLIHPTANQGLHVPT